MNYSMYKEILENHAIPKEHKLFCILEMLHSDMISLEKAKELCYESGLFNKTSAEIDYEVTSLYGDWTDINTKKF